MYTVNHTNRFPLPVLPGGEWAGIVYLRNECSDRQISLSHFCLRSNAYVNASCRDSCDARYLRACVGFDITT